MNQNKQLLIDFDGTLAYREGMWAATIKEIISEDKSLNLTPILIEEIEPYTLTGFPWQDYEIPHKDFFEKKSWWNYMTGKVENILLKFNIPRDKAKKLSLRFKEKYLNIKYWKLFDDTVEMLEVAKKRDIVCNIASNHTPELAYLVEELGLKSYITHIFNSADIGYEKPHCKFYQKILSTLRVQPKQLIMIGDNYIADITGARSNEIPAILVRSKNNFNYKYYSYTFKGIFELQGISI